MLKRLGYYLFFLTLILVLGVSGISGILGSSTVYFISGGIIAISLLLALWFTFVVKGGKPLPRLPVQSKPKKSAKAPLKLSSFLPILIGIGTLLSAGAAFAYCPPLAEVQSDLLADCMICDFTELFLNAINKVVTESYNILTSGTGPAITLLALGFALWLGWHIGNYFITYKYSDPMEFLSEIGRCAFRVTFIFAILILPVSVAFDFVISPIVSMATELTLSIVNTDALMEAVAASGGEDNYCALALDNARMEDLLKDNFMALSPQMINSVLCIIQSVFFETVKGQTIGLGIACYGLHSLVGFLIFVPDLGMWFIGALIYVVFLYISFAIAVRLIDFIIRIAFVLMLLPLLMVAWVFPITRTYTKKGWDLFVNSLVSLVTIAIAMALIVELTAAALGIGGTDIDSAIADNTEGTDNVRITTQIYGVNIATVETNSLNEAINNNRVNDLFDQIYTNGIDWILFLAILFICILITKASASIAQHLAPIGLDLAGSNIGAAAGARIMTAAMHLVKTAVTAVQIVATVATLGVGGVAIGAGKAAGKVAAEVAKKAAAASAKAATKAGFGGAVKTISAAGSKVASGASKAATTVKKATAPIAKGAKKVGEVGRNIKDKAQGFRDKVDKATAKAAAEIARKPGGKAALKVARHARDYAKKLPEKMYKGATAHTQQTEQENTGDEGRNG